VSSPPGRRVVAAIADFLQLEAAGGILLFAAAAAAMAMANSSAAPLYEAFLGTRVELRAGAFEIAKPLVLWINDGLMALFFFLVGLEVKREVLEGEWRSPPAWFAHGVPAGIAFGLLAGKALGIFGAVLLAVKLGLARLPENANFLHMAGVALVCGIGFTMSLFIAGLAFEEEMGRFANESRLGILFGSAAAGLAGYLFLRLAARS